MSKRPRCEGTIVPGCRNIIPRGGEGHPEICPPCLAVEAAKNNTPAAKVRREFSHYYREVPFDGIDLYRIFLLFKVDDPCIQHAIKKLMAAGQRGSKDAARDVHEAIASMTRWQDMRAEEAEVASQDVRPSKGETR